VDLLLGTGSSLRRVSKLVSIPRSTLSRHRQHAQVTGPKFALIRTEDVPGGTDDPLDPLTEALRLAARARTDRELLKASEAVRSATALQVRALRGADVDAEMLEQLDSNIREAEALYRRVGGFENELRGLAGHRQAIAHRLEAVRAGGSISVPVEITLPGGRPLPLPGEARPATWKLTREQYFSGVPSRFRNDRFAVKRLVKLQWPSSGGEPAGEVEVYDLATGGLVWRGET
jgi:hypothetical protein